MDCKEKFKTMLADIHRELLKPNGFRKTGQNFRRVEKSGAISYAYVINFQKSAWNWENQLRFAINIGRKTVFGDIEPDFSLNELGWEYFDRLGFMCYGHDKWWEITPDTDMDEMKREIIHLLRDAALPRFEKGKFKVE